MRRPVARLGISHSVMACRKTFPNELASARAATYPAAFVDAILSDPDWHEGDYLATGALPTRGVALARMVGHLTYMSADGMSDRFGRELREGSFSPDDLSLIHI